MVVILLLFIFQLKYFFSKLCFFMIIPTKFIYIQNDTNPLSRLRYFRSTLGSTLKFILKVTSLLHYSYQSVLLL